MRPLFIVDTSAIHAAKWIRQFNGCGWETDVFQARTPDWPVCPEFPSVRLHVHYPVPVPAGMECSYTLRHAIGPIAARLFGSTVARRAVRRQHARYLAGLIGETKPDAVHVLGLGVNWRNMAEPVLDALDGGLRMPCPLVYSSWGTDLECFAALPEQQVDVRRFLAAADYHITECERDARLARSLGFRGECLGTFPAFGGTDMGAMSRHRTVGPASSRRTIVLKGRDHARGGDPIGRAMAAMEAFRECRGELQGYRIAILQANPVVVEAAERLKSEGLDIAVMPRLDYAEVLNLVGSARVFISLTVNDGLPSSLVEAMALGAMPLHSDLEPIREWITDGENGLLVPAEDVGATITALRRALTDDELVDRADRKNGEIVRSRLEYNVVRQRAIEMYEKVAGLSRKR